jgi:hypothetical protein
MSFCNERARGQSPACEARKIRCRRVRTWRWTLRQLTLFQSVGRLGPFAEPLTRIQLAPGLALSTTLFGGVTRSMSAPFEVGYRPIQPVMTSRCLSAAGLRFLDHPVPTGDFRRSCVRPPDLGQTPLGFPRSAPARADWGGCLLYSGGMVSLLATCGHRQPSKHVYDLSCFCPSIAVLVSPRVRQLQFTEPQRRFTSVHPSSLSLAWVVLMTNPALGLCLSRQTLPLLAVSGETGNRLWTQAWMRPFLRIARLVRPRVAPTLSGLTSLK